MKQLTSRLVLAGMLVAIAGALLWHACKPRRRHVRQSDDRVARSAVKALAPEQRDV